MAKHLQRELEKIKKLILTLGALVEERVHMAIKAIETRDADQAEQIIKLDYEIDEMEVEVEEECLKILALHQPVAVDLRFLTSVIKINNDLERIGDEAVNIAERVKFLAASNHFEFRFDFTEMAEKVENMLKRSLDSLVNLDVDLALKICLLDDEVDDLHNESYGTIEAAIKQHTDQVGQLINLLFISRHFERIADHATNISEEVIYLIEGEIVRHGISKEM